MSGMSGSIVGCHGSIYGTAWNYVQMWFNLELHGNLMNSDSVQDLVEKSRVQDNLNRDWKNPAMKGRRIDSGYFGNFIKRYLKTIMPLTIALTERNRTMPKHHTSTNDNTPSGKYETLAKILDIFTYSRLLLKALIKILFIFAGRKTLETFDRNLVLIRSIKKMNNL